MASPRPLFTLPGPSWLFLIAGLALLTATVLLPAQVDLRNTMYQRDRALAAEAQQAERLYRHQRYLAAVVANDPTVVRSLTLTQLRRLPSGRTPLLDTNLPDADVLPALEPPEVQPPAPPYARSLLERLATSREHRLWLIAAAALMIFLGLLPTSSTRTL